ncbi:MAG: hypothetical protein V1747_07395 [Candidatus Omnitrophota bacterium]
MMKKILGYVLVLSLFLTAYQCSVVLAGDAEMTMPTMAMGAKTQSVFGVVGNVEYTEFKTRGESAIVIKDKKGESVEVSLKQVEQGATILATYRKEKDKKGKEKNVLISLSIVKPAQNIKTSDRKK